MSDSPTATLPQKKQPTPAQAWWLRARLSRQVGGDHRGFRAQDACLSHCQAPLTFIMRHGGFRGDPSGAVTLGLRHGLYCIGCCWALMALLFVGGVMNLLWIAALATLVLAEKVIPFGRLVARIAGVCFVAAGIWLLTPSAMSAFIVAIGAQATLAE